MAKKKSTKKALLASVLALTLSSSMLVGTTFAWFTDSVTSSNNIIQTGTLDVSLEYSDEALTDVNDAKWVDASQGAIFNYSNWEPGYTAVKYVKIENEGSLDLKFTLSIIPNGEAGEVNLADVIEVYMVSGATAVERSALTPDSAYYVGNLTSLMNDKDGAAYGVLYADDADKAGNVYEIYTIALKMSTSAGNEYQGKSVGGGFAVQLLATQLASEEDSFDNKYDEDAKYPGEADVWDGTVDTVWYNDTDSSFSLSTAEEVAGLAELVNGGNNFSKKTIELESNVDLNGNSWTPLKSFAGTLKGNDHTIGNFSVDATAGNGGFIDSLEWGTINDLTLSDVEATVGGYRFGVLANKINQSNVENVVIKNVKVTTTASSAFVAGLFATGTVNSNMEVNNCTVENFTVNAEAGAYLIGGITTVVQKNGTEAEGTNIFENLHVKNFKVTVNDTDGVCGVGGLVGQTQSVWQNPRFNNCTVTGLDIVATGIVDVGGFICYPGSITFAENCSAEGKIDVSGVTSPDSFAGGFFSDYGWGDNISKGDHKVTSCYADVDITTKVATAGGFVGSGTNSEGRNKNITLTNCEAKGAVTVVEGGSAIIGGFAGQTDRGIYVNCTAAQAPFIGKVIDGYTLTDDGNGTLTVSK
ncbi:MAG: hypothetical protein E7381_05785 [Clostridiales bacterium]|nr:hypothetical protein [Clostridiales bacterium]